MILYVSRDLRRRRLGQSGSSFLVVLVIIALATILFATVLSYSATPRLTGRPPCTPASATPGTRRAT